MTEPRTCVSTLYGLPHDQSTLDFVDVDVIGDTRVFLDPRALRFLPSDWGSECVDALQRFFQTVLRCIERGEDGRARRLLESLREPNETHLGLSHGRARGRALGPQTAADVWNALSRSEAARSGLLENLEDTVLLVEGIGPDIVSDICTNIIRGQLIRYTQEICGYYGIPLRQDVDSGPVWDPESERWSSHLVELPIAERKKLLLVPKILVRRRLEYDQGEYFNGPVLDHLMAEELSANTELVKLLKGGRRKVTKKDLKEKYGSGIGTIVRETLRAPQILDGYRRDRTLNPRGPLSLGELAETTDCSSPDLRGLLAAMRAIPPGDELFDDYERAAEKLLSAVFYPALTMPSRHKRIHQGRKIIDILYVNAAKGYLAKEGIPLFFSWLGSHYQAMQVVIECKNYSGSIGNPEVDQVSGRFSPLRGRVGFLVCRSIEDKGRAWARCRDTALDDRGFVMPIDDEDLAELVRVCEDLPHSEHFNLLKRWFDSLI